MKRELAIEFSRVTEAAALAGYKWLGRGDKNVADGAAVHAMRIMLNQVNIDGTIVIGEGEIDEAPMLYIGEKVGTGNTILAKPRHDAVIADMQTLGVRVFAIPDGDVAASILTCMPDSEVDVLYGIGGAPEGVVSAAVIRALDGDMQGRLLARHTVKGDSEENRRIGEQELARCKAMGIEANTVLRLDDMARNDNVIFSATGITKGDLLDGITRKGNMATTETLLIRGKSRTIRRIKSIHYLDRKDVDVQRHIL
ncbi:MAG: glpX [Enterobacter kobei]|nr:glpX [Enterobacter kobei]